MHNLTGRQNEYSVKLRQAEEQRRRACLTKPLFVKTKEMRVEDKFKADTTQLDQVRKQFEQSLTAKISPQIHPDILCKFMKGYKVSKPIYNDAKSVTSVSNQSPVKSDFVEEMTYDIIKDQISKAALNLNSRKQDGMGHKLYTFDNIDHVVRV